MDPRFMIWLQALNSRDLALMQLAGIGLLLVLGWVSIRLIPQQLQSLFRKLYLIGGTALYLFLFIYSIRQ